MSPVDRQLHTELESPLDLNTASEEALRRLPGIGPKLAARIVAAREAQGGFEHVGELLLVQGVTAKALDRLLDQLIVSSPHPPSSHVPTSRHLALIVSNRLSAPEPEAAAEATPPSGPMARAVTTPPLPAQFDDAGLWPDPEPASVAPAEVAPASVAPASAASARVAAEPPEVKATIPVVTERPPRSARERAPRSGRETIAAEPVVVEARSAEPPSKPDAPPRRRWARVAVAATLGLAALIALGFTAGTTGAMYGGKLLGYATQSDVKAQTEQLWSEIDAVKSDQRKVSATVDLMAEVAAQFPRTVEQVGSLRTGVEAQQKEAADVTAANQRLNREVANLREAMRKSQRETERRMFEMRLDLESGPRDRSLRPSTREIKPPEPVVRKRP